MPARYPKKILLGTSFKVRNSVFNFSRLVVVNEIILLEFVHVLVHLPKII